MPSAFAARHAKPGTSLARWWQGYVRRRNSARLARYQVTHKPRIQRAARAALWLHVAVYLAVMAVMLSGCAFTRPAPPGVQMTDDERKACEAHSCTVWTPDELQELVRRVFRKGYDVGVKSI